MSTKLQRNIGYQTLYQIIVTITPLITAPYLAHVLGASQQGVYSYTLSITSYFLMFAMLGYENQGTRCVAKAGEDISLRSRAFFSVYYLQLSTSVLAIIAYFMYLLIFCKSNIFIAELQGLMLLACVFNINWFFAGIENFKVIALRNIIVKITTVTSILLLVKRKEDLWVYTIIMALSTLIGNISVWSLLRGKLQLTRVRKEELIANIKPVLLLFVPLFAMSIYHYMDITMLGILSNYENSGYYYNADKVVNIPLGVITAISTVMFPRVVATLENNKNKFEMVFSKTFEGVSLVAVAFSFGIAAISNEFVPFFFGSQFNDCIILIKYLAPVMIIKSISTVLRYQYLIPKGMDKGFIYSVFIGAIVDLLANYLLIPEYGALGAVIGTLLAEFASCIYQLYYIKDGVKIIHLFKPTLPYYFIGICMFVFVRIVPLLFKASDALLTLLEVFVGVVVFSLLAIAYWVLVRERTILDSIIPNQIKRRIVKTTK